MKNIFVKSAAILCFVTILFTGCTEKSDVKSFNAMDTFMTVQSYGKNCSVANKMVQTQVHQLEELFSTTKETSEIYKINNYIEENDKKSTQKQNFVSPQTYELVTFALEMAEKTQGALNPALYPIIKSWGFTTGKYTIPSQTQIELLLQKTDFTKVRTSATSEGQYLLSMDQDMELDLGAVGKGYAGDQAIKLLSSQGIKSAIIDFGGNVQTLGTKPDGSFWNIGIKNPWDGTILCGVKVADQAVITSGGYERNFTAQGKTFIHIFDGITGRPVQNEIKSVTIVAASGVYGDALSTALFVMGLQKAVSFWQQYKDFDFIIITQDKNIYYTKGLSGRIKTLSDSFTPNQI